MSLMAASFEPNWTNKRKDGKPKRPSEEHSVAAASSNKNRL